MVIDTVEKTSLLKKNKNVQKVAKGDPEKTVQVIGEALLHTDHRKEIGDEKFQKWLNNGALGRLGTKPSSLELFNALKRIMSVHFW